METKVKRTHTPGPWLLDGSGITTILDGEEVQIAMMARTRWGGDISDKTRKLAAKFKGYETGDALLIAAAPDLLRLVKQYRQEAIAQGADVSDVKEIDKVLRMAGEDI